MSQVFMLLSGLLADRRVCKREGEKRVSDHVIMPSTCLWAFFFFFLSHKHQHRVAQDKKRAGKTGREPGEKP